MFIINNNSSISKKSCQIFWHGGETKKMQSKKVKVPENKGFLHKEEGMEILY